MAKFKAFAARDSKLSVFMNPMFFQHAGQAARVWEELINGGDTLPSKYPADFALYEVGSFDSETGVFENCQHILIATGLDVKRKAEQASGAQMTMSDRPRSL